MSRTPRESLESSSITDILSERAQKDIYSTDYWHTLPINLFEKLELPKVPKHLKDWVSVRWVTKLARQNNVLAHAATTRDGIPLVEITLQTGGNPIVERYPLNEVERELHIFFETAMELMSERPNWSDE